MTAEGIGGAPLPEADWHARIAVARQVGDHLAAVDLAAQALDDHPRTPGFEYAATLALARSGATDAARARYDSLAASGLIAAIADPALAVDFAALDGRLWKDLAGRHHGEAAVEAIRKAASAYASAHDRFGGYYPAINAASMYLAAGESDRAKEYAGIAFRLALQDDGDYWAVVTQAEALLILGDTEAAAGRLTTLAADPAHLDELASTRRQLDWVVRLTRAPAAVTDALPAPRVLYWKSSGTAALLPAWVAAPFRQRLIAFGPVLRAADVETAGALLVAGAEMNLVLPCEAGLWCATLGLEPAVLARVLDNAASVLLVTPEGGPHEPAARLLCQQQAHGLAWLRAESLAVQPELLPHGEDTRPPPPLPPTAIRQPRAIVFGDVRGFSRLSEAGQLDFLTHVIGGFAEVLEGARGVEYAETAGDGLYLVLSDVRAAVECCFALREVMRPERIAAAGLPNYLGLRLSAHVGPVYRRHDPVIGRDKFCGMEVIRTARIEPVTPVGEIFVTEQFAAVLAAEAHGDYVCEYAGRQSMAKGFGECRMYSLRRSR